MEKAVKKINGTRNMKSNRILFYSILIFIPVIHFLIFYVYINFNSIVLAFKKYELTPTSGYVSSLVWFENFAEAWKALTARAYLIKNSLIFLAVDVCIVTPLALLFSFYMYKKGKLSSFFKVMLFMPQLLSGVILGLLYKYVSTDVYLWFAEKMGVEVNGGLLSNIDTRMGTMIFFNVFMGFGVNVLLYVGAMSGVNVSLTESAELDGASPMQVLYHIILPLIFPTIATVLIVYISHLFTNQANLYTLLGEGADKTGTMGYFLYIQAKGSNLVAPNDNMLSYPVLSAMGVILTAIILPITMLLRHLMNKYGPSVD